MSLIVTAEIFENDDIYQKEKARKKVVEKMTEEKKKSDSGYNLVQN